MFGYDLLELLGFAAQIPDLARRRSPRSVSRQALLPSLKGPTVASIYQSDWFAVEAIIENSLVRDLIPKLLKEGAEGIIEYSLNKVM